MMTGSNVNVLEWSRSPDMNLMKNLWGEVNIGGLAWKSSSPKDLKSNYQKSENY